MELEVKTGYTGTGWYKVEVYLPGKRYPEGIDLWATNINLVKERMTEFYSDALKIIIST